MPTRAPVPDGVAVVNIEVAKVELRWFFSEAEGDLGLRAAALEPGVGGESCPHERARKRLSSASRYADVHSRYRKLPRRHQRALSLAYTPHRWVDLGDWYELAGVAAWLSCRSNVSKGAKRVALLKAAPRDEMRARATHVLGLALEAFREVTPDAR